MRQTYWKLVSEEYPEGEIFEDKESALMASKNYRNDGQKAYIRAIKITKYEYEHLEELN